MRYLLLLLALLSGFSASAQTLPVTHQADSLVTLAPSAATDTAAAIHRLFTAKRQQTAGPMAFIAAAVVLGAVTVASSQHSSFEAAPIFGAFVSVIGVPVLIIQAAHYNRFSHRKERRALAAFSAHKLPKRVQRQLRPLYFRPVRAVGK